MCQGTVRTAGKDDRHPGAKDNARSLCIGQVLQLLGQHIARLQVWHNENIGPASDRGDDAFGTGSFRRHRVIKGQRAIYDSAGDLTAIGHLAQRCRFQGGLDLRSDGFDGRENRDPGNRIAEYVSQIDGVLHDITFRLQVGIDVEGSIGQ